VAGFETALKGALVVTVVASRLAVRLDDDSSKKWTKKST
jgi:hypothetical protein